MTLSNQIDESFGDLFDPEEWIFVEPEEAIEDDEEEAIEDDEEEEMEEVLPTESEHSNINVRSSSKSIDFVAKLQRFQFSAFSEKRESKDIRVLVKDHVLPFLPAKSLTRFRAVSTEWNQRIESPFLAHQQSYFFQKLSGFFCQHHGENIAFLTMNHHSYGVPSSSLSFLPESVTIKSSSNGLLLCQDQNGNNTYYICNPVNKEWKELPQPQYYHGPESAIILAFEPSVLNMDASYLLICPVIICIYQPVIYFEVYSSRTRSWTESTTVCLELGADTTIRDNGFYIKGTAYWETSSRKVLAFNLTNDVHEIISLPDGCPQEGILTQTNEELCYIGISHRVNRCFIKIYGGLHLSLIHTVELHLEMELHRSRVLPCLDGNMVMVLNGGVLHSYSVKDRKLEVISNEAGSSESKYLSYVNTLVSVG